MTRDRSSNTRSRPRGSRGARLGRRPLVRPRRRRDRGCGGRLSAPPADGLAAARGRDARRSSSAATRSASSSRSCSRSAAAHRSTSCSPGWSPTSVSGWRGCGSSRLAFAVASLPVIALLARAARRPRAGARRERCSSPRAGSSSSTASTGGCTASSSSRARSRTSRCCTRSTAAGGGRWALWALAILATVATHPYGALVLASQAVFVLVGAPRPDARGALGLRRGRRARHPVLAHRPRARGPVRRRRRRRRREARRAVPVSSTCGRRQATSAPASRCCRPCSCSPRPAAARLSREARALAGCGRGVPVAAFLAVSLGGATSPESRHLIFVLPFFALLVGAGARAARTRVGASRRSRCSSPRRSRGPGTGRRRSSSGSRTPARRPAPRRPRTSRRRAGPTTSCFGYEPLFLRRVGAATPTSR